MIRFLGRKDRKNRSMSPRHRLKNPFTMSKKHALRAISPAKAGKPLSSSPEIICTLVELIGIEPMT
ncbi:hypothetical protein [Sphingobium indicum]|uniref:hypothetical protein n=1 Tax=Sphingobium indicum TaxID=332055 RepID=UPI0011DFDD31|nr:hypothetical protein [Sphingobium indicum]